MGKAVHSTLKDHKICLRGWEIECIRKQEGVVMANKISIIVEVEVVEVRKESFVVLWESGISGRCNVYRFHYNIKRECRLGLTYTQVFACETHPVARCLRKGNGREEKYLTLFEYILTQFFVR